MIIYRTFVVIALTAIVSMLLVAQTTIASQSEAPQEENRRMMTAWDTLWHRRSVPTSTATFSPVAPIMPAHGRS